MVLHLCGLPAPNLESISNHDETDKLKLRDILQNIHKAQNFQGYHKEGTVEKQS